jgi:hypothetical protein
MAAPRCAATAGSTTPGRRPSSIRARSTTTGCPRVTSPSSFPWPPPATRTTPSTSSSSSSASTSTARR